MEAVSTGVGCLHRMTSSSIDYHYIQALVASYRSEQAVVQKLTSELFKDVTVDERGSSVRARLSFIESATAVLAECLERDRPEEHPFFRTAPGMRNAHARASLLEAYKRGAGTSFTGAARTECTY
jgi:hypothetical protein